MLLISYPPLISFLTDISGIPSYIILSEGGNFFITDTRFINDIGDLPENYSPLIFNNSLFSLLKEKKILDGVKRLGIDGANISYDQVSQIITLKSNLQIINMTKEFASMLSQHDEDSILKLKKSIGIAKKSFFKLLDTINVGMSEKECSDLITAENSKLKHSFNSFEPIIAFGTNSSIPHVIPTKTKLKKNDIVLIDMGVSFRGICSDFTRTFGFGEPPHKNFIPVLELMEKIIHEVESMLRPGIAVSSLDLHARSVMAEYGFEQFFLHSLGHGIGYTVHQSPRISKHSSEVLMENQVVTIEPGIYFPKKFGVRIEQMYHIKKDSAELLTSF